MTQVAARADLSVPKQAVRLLSPRLQPTIVAFLGVLVLCLPRPLPTVDAVSQMPWWAPLGGLVGAFAVVAGLLFVSKVGAGAFAGLTITANILMSLAIDQFGWFGMPTHALSAARCLGAALMVTGIALISFF